MTSPCWRHGSQDPAAPRVLHDAAPPATWVGRTLQYINSNRLVKSRPGWDIELQKTGYIVEAGHCLTMVTKMGDHDLIMVLLDSDSNGARTNDAERMRRWVVAQWGLPNPVARAKPEAEPDRRVAAGKKDGKGKKDVAKKESGKKTTAVAKKKDTGKKTAVAKKEPAKKSTAQASAKSKDARAKEGTEAKRKGGRVSQTFASGTGERKS